MAEKSLDELIAEISTNTNKLREVLGSIPADSLPDKEQRETIKQALAALQDTKKAVDDYTKSRKKFTVDTVVMINSKIRNKR